MPRCATEAVDSLRAVMKRRRPQPLFPTFFLDDLRKIKKKHSTSFHTFWEISHFGTCWESIWIHLATMFNNTFSAFQLRCQGRFECLRYFSCRQGAPWKLFSESWVLDGLGNRVATKAGTKRAASTSQVFQIDRHRQAEKGGQQVRFTL